MANLNVRMARRPTVDDFSTVGEAFHSSDAGAGVRLARNESLLADSLVANIHLACQIRQESS